MSLPARAETILAAFVFVLVVYILALTLPGRKIRRVDMAESLKNVEEEENLKQPQNSPQKTLDLE